MPLSVLVAAARCVAAFQVGAIGAVVSQVSSWKIMLAIAIVPAVIFAAANGSWRY